ncbi:MAG: hypothetical protein ACTSYF_09375, partial [Promethearchaeota archaeon]
MNLERDFNEKSTIKNYIITAKGVEILARFISALNGENVSAWSLTGPYGMGKSAFANFLIALTGSSKNPETKLALQKLYDADNTLHTDLVKSLSNLTNRKGLLRIPITASYEPINKTLLLGLYHALNNRADHSNNTNKLIKLKSHLKKLCVRDNLDSKTVLETFITARDNCGVPILLVVDEFGKNLEYMAHHPHKGDIFAMQLLAET